MVEKAVIEKRRFFELWKTGSSRAAYNTAKRESNRAVHQTKNVAEKVARLKIGPRYADIYRLAKKCSMTTRMSWERNLLRTIQGNCRYMRKQKGNFERA